MVIGSGPNGAVIQVKYKHSGADAAMKTITSKALQYYYAEIMDELRTLQ